MTKLRVVMFAPVLAVMLAWAVPAMACPATSAATITVTAGKPSEFHFTLSAMSVPHGTVTFSFTNKGALPHDFKVCSSPKGGSATSCAGTGTAVTSPGEEREADGHLQDGRQLRVSLHRSGGHAAAGMKGDLKVT